MSRQRRRGGRNRDDQTAPGQQASAEYELGTQGEAEDEDRDENEAAEPARLSADAATIAGDDGAEASEPGAEDTGERSRSGRPRRDRWGRNRSRGEDRGRRAGRDGGEREDTPSARMLRMPSPSMRPSWPHPCHGPTPAQYLHQHPLQTPHPRSSRRAAGSRLPRPSPRAHRAQERLVEQAELGANLFPPRPHEGGGEGGVRGLFASEASDYVALALPLLRPLDMPVEATPSPCPLPHMRGGEER
jgi:hypothetical protein